MVSGKKSMVLIRSVSARYLVKAPMIICIDCCASVGEPAEYHTGSPNESTCLISVSLDMDPSDHTDSMPIKQIGS
jgi:hypothetical protein